MYLQDETPLFLAAREGSFGACKTLLDNFANREITDHMDRLPRDVAGERLHTDIVRLLDEHIPRSPQMLSVVPNSAGQLLGKYCNRFTSAVYLFFFMMLGRHKSKCRWFVLLFDF